MQQVRRVSSVVALCLERVHGAVRPSLRHVTGRHSHAIEPGPLNEPQAQTPGAGPGGAAAGAAAAATPHAPPSWLTDLDAYLHASSVPTEGRHELVAAVKASPASAEAWVALLSAEEAAGGGGLTSGLTGGLTGGGGVSLYHMYYWATQLVPRGGAHQSKEDYVRLWLGYARQQWCAAPALVRPRFPIRSRLLLQPHARRPRMAPADLCACAWAKPPPHHNHRAQTTKPCDHHDDHAPAGPAAPMTRATLSRRCATARSAPRARTSTPTGLGSSTRRATCRARWGYWQRATRTARSPSGARARAWERGPVRRWRRARARRLLVVCGPRVDR